MVKKLENPPMKAVLYHADARFGLRHGEGIYKDLVEGLKQSLHTFGVPLIHVTLKGHEGWGDENVFYEVDDPGEVIYNREKCLLEFLKNDAEENVTYWFCEPDFRMLKEFPPLTTDLCMLYRNDPVAITPAWRLAKKSALPFWEEAFTYFNTDMKEWHGDSRCWVKMWEQLGSPKLEAKETKQFTYNGMTVELRPYGHYASRHKQIYSGQWKGGSKMQIVSDEYRAKVEQEKKK